MTTETPPTPTRCTASCTDSLDETDPEIAGCDRQGTRPPARQDRADREREHLPAAPCSRRTGSVLTNKYAEGYPGKRYYGGCEYVDEVETLAIERAKELFGCNFANVQPNSGSQMNQAVFLALLQPGDTFMGLDLAAGGHLTHGSPVNMSGKWFKPVPYGVRRDDHRIDMDEVAPHRPRAQAQADHRRRHRLFAPLGLRRASARSPTRSAPICWPTCRTSPASSPAARTPRPFPHAHVVTTTTHKSLRGPRSRHDPVPMTRRWPRRSTRAVFPGLQGGPLMHVIAAKAVAFGEALQPEFKAYARAVVENAKALAASLRGARVSTSSRAAPTTT